jgi:hypothetical protein
MVCIVTIIISLAYWALRLLEQAYERREFSRILAAMLVIFAAGGVLTTYFFMSDYIYYLTQEMKAPISTEGWQDQVLWLAEDN